MKNKILVTGADGFIGSHLVEALVSKGFDVRAFVYYNSRNSWGWLDLYEERLPENLEIFSGDIRDPNGVFDAMLDCKMVFHLAALIGIPFSYHSPDTYLQTNVNGALNILQAARKQNVERVIMTSTSEVYGTGQYLPIDEDHPYQAQSPYSASKIASDMLASSFFCSFDTPVVIARPFNTYGPRQSARAVIPTIITQLLSGQTELKLGDINPTRDFNYVQDTVNAFIALLECEAVIGQTFNFASGEDYSILDVANILIKIINPRAKVVLDQQRVRPKNSEVQRLLGDSQKMRSLTGWQSNVRLEDGLKQTVEWFRNKKNLSAYKAKEYNV
jgi:NAD dependent epimerase/dehydratase